MHLKARGCSKSEMPAPTNEPGSQERTESCERQQCREAAARKWHEKSSANMQNHVSWTWKATRREEATPAAS